MLLSEAIKLLDIDKIDLYCDLDGVLFDFDKKVKELLGKYPNEMDKKQLWQELTPHIKNGFFKSLDLKPDAEFLWSFIKKYKPTILTATGHIAAPIVAQDKIMAVHEKFGSHVKVLTVHSSNEKAKYAKPNAILIDDKEKSIRPWIDAGGIGILHKSAAKTIAKLKEYGL
ncbi:MAG: hypothetical protein NZZ41_08040 [Candidatus Dojkabacteria bacterium]|nr:hypothetical protein [Candidatus Dojkabacteria bacterium]